jgi:hypothetical protein
VKSNDFQIDLENTVHADDDPHERGGPDPQREKFHQEIPERKAFGQLLRFRWFLKLNLKNWLVE